MPRKPTIGIRFTTEDVDLLDALAAKEERNRSDIVRRAIRAYAEKIGVESKPRKKPAGKR